MDIPAQRCKNCSLLLRYLRYQPLRSVEENVFNILTTWVFPTPISRNDSICVECFEAVQSVIHLGPAPEPLFGHTSVCFACGKSTLRSRTSRVPFLSEERNIIVTWIYPHLVHHLERVCRACWMAAKRNVQRQQQQDAQRFLNIEENEQPELELIPVNDRDNQVLVQEQIPVDAGNHQVPELLIPAPPPLPQVAINQPQERQRESKIISNKYKRVASSPRYCLFHGCQNEERLLMPRAIKEEVLSRYRIYIPPSARICNFHKYNDRWGELRADMSDFTSRQMDNILNMFEHISVTKLNFSNIHMLPAHLCHYWLGMNATQFYELLNEIPELHNKVTDASVALSIYLAKIRSGDSNERLTGLFNMKRSTLEHNMNKTRQELTENFVPRYLGIGHMPIQQVAANNTVIPDGLFGNPQLPIESKPAILLCDATYVYVQNSSNYLFQKQTFSLHKHLNLVKPFMIVCCNGKIIDCLGPYRATTNDATIMAKEFENPDGPMRSYVREHDIFILDRGFRDVIPQLERYGYQAYMPESVLEGQHQLTTEQANKTRCITMYRWVIEVVNGRLKRDYKIFRQDFCNRAAKHLMEDFRIGCALINKFHPVIEDKPEYFEYLEIAKRRINLPNYLASTIERENYNRRRAVFLDINGDHPHLNGFPRLTIDDLKKLAIGTYQLKQARSYYGEHIRQNGTYMVQINDTIDEDIPLALGVNNYLIRGRIKSRHITGRTYFANILVNRDQAVANTLAAITGYCCNCLVGNRTVGCCAHVMTVVWYLSWARFNDVSAPAYFLDEIFEEYAYEYEIINNE